MSYTTSLGILLPTSALFAIAVAAAANDRALPASIHPHETVAAVASAPMAFTQNAGQWPDSILFRAESHETTLWFTQTGIGYQVVTRPASEQSLQKSQRSVLGKRATPPSYRVEWVRMDFVASEPASKLVPSEPISTSVNFVLGNDPAKWQSNVPTFACVTYRGLYPGVDLVFRETRGQVECELVGTEATRIAQARVRFSGAHFVSAGATGELMLSGQNGDLALRPLTGLQFEKSLDGSYGLRPESNRSASAAAPAAVGLFYGTYFGGGGEDSPFEIVVDSAGSAYVTGYTLSVDFPTVNAFQADSTGYDVFVMKFSPGGGSLEYATYLGGNGADLGFDVKVDSSGKAYVTGYTASTDFPTLNNYQGDQPGTDAFVTKLNAAGNGLVYSTYLGGSGVDEAYGLVVSPVGIVCIAGRTTSTDLPLLNAFQTDQGGRDGFVAQLSPAGQNLIYGTYLGGSSDDQILAVSRDTAGYTYVTGVSNSTDFPTQGEFQLHQGDADVFVTKLNVPGNGLVYSTYIGGALEDAAQALVVDSAGQAYVAGYTLSTDFPTVNPYQSDPADLDYDAYVLKLSAAGNSLLYSTYLSGGIDEYAFALAVDPSGSAYVSGMTGSPDFPTVNEYQTFQGEYDAFAIRLNAAGNNAVFSTYLGGSGTDFPDGMILDRWGSLYLIGSTYSTDFPTLHPYQGDQPDGDGFLVKLCADLDVDCVPDAVDNCPTTYNPLQEDTNGNSIGDACDVGDTLVFALYSPVDLVITDPAGDSIGIDSLSRVIFNTILNGSTYDTLTDENSSALTGPDGEPDDIVTIPVPIAGAYRVRIVAEPTANPNAHFTNAIRINGNQQLVPDEYHDATVSQLGSPEVPSQATYVTALTLPGDANADGLTTSADIIYMVNYVFKSGLSPVVPGHGDVNCDGLNTSADIIYLVNYVFKSGLSPCSQTGG